VMRGALSTAEAHVLATRALTAERFSPTGLPCYDSAVHRISSVIRYVWAAPTTALGLVVVLTGLWRARVWVLDGVVEAHGPAFAWLLSHFTLMPGGAAALTLGHVVVARDNWSLESTRAHERVHVRQCELWGPLFVPAYLAASLSATLRGGNFYFDNRFEIEAFHAARNESEAREHGSQPRREPSSGART
jgi:hypothetical protein